MLALSAFITCVNLLPVQVDLGKNLIGAEGAKHIADAMRVSASLTQVLAFLPTLPFASLAP